LAEVRVLTSFLRKAKKFLKKFPSLVTELEMLADSLRTSPGQGTHLGSGLYKIRLASESKGRGKSGGFRIITYYIPPSETGHIVYLITIYDKSEESSISKEELQELIRRHLG
jgi:hypothetical protein